MFRLWFMFGWLGAVTRAIYIIFVAKPKFICAKLGNGVILQCLCWVTVRTNYQMYQRTTILNFAMPLAKCDFHHHIWGHATAVAIQLKPSHIYGTDKTTKIRFYRDFCLFHISWNRKKGSELKRRKIWAKYRKRETEEERDQNTSNAIINCKITEFSKRRINWSRLNSIKSIWVSLS